MILVMDTDEFYKQLANPCEIPLHRCGCGSEQIDFVVQIHEISHLMCADCVADLGKHIIDGLR